jgi:hypothetical protein
MKISIVFLTVIIIAIVIYSQYFEKQNPIIGNTSGIEVIEWTQPGTRHEYLIFYRKGHEGIAVVNKTVDDLNAQYLRHVIITLGINK